MELIRKIGCFSGLKRNLSDRKTSKSTKAKEVINQAIESRDNIKIDLNGEEFSTRIIHFDSSNNTFIADSIMPKYGDEQLSGGKAYLFKQNHYRDGVISQLEFLAVYRKSIEFDGILSHVFNLPHEVLRKSTFSDIKPKPKDNLKVRFSYDSREYSFRISRMNIQNLHFIAGEGELDILLDGCSLEEGYISLPGDEIKIGGMLYQETKYEFRLEIKTISAQDHRKLADYIGNESRILRGFERVGYPQKSVPAKSQKKNAPEVELKKRKILIIDDDLQSDSILSNTLTSRGFQCYVYNDRVNLTEIVLKQKPNLIILSVSIWLNLLQKLKRNRMTSTIPVVIFTRSASARDVVEASEAGAAHYFIKSPDLDMDEFTSKIESFIQSP